MKHGKNNRGAHHLRTRVFYGKGVNREKVFADMWEKENKPNRGVNHGHGVLQDLFFDTKDVFPNDFLHARATLVLTDRERMIAATAVQWLGSNCGWCWLEETLRECGYKLTKITERKK